MFGETVFCCATQIFELFTIFTTVKCSRLYTDSFTLDEVLSNRETDDFLLCITQQTQFIKSCLQTLLGIRFCVLVWKLILLFQAFSSITL